MACGDNFTTVLNERGQVYSFGKGSNGRLGVGKREDPINTLKLYERKSDDSSDSYRPPIDNPEQVQSSLPSFKDIIQVATGCRHAAALSAEGQMFTWGFNYYD